MEIFLNRGKDSLSKEEILNALNDSMKNRKLSKVLIIPPDFTRFHSNAGLITNFYYHYFINRGIEVDILPALGTHDAISEKEASEMFGDIPYEKFIYHDWRNDVVKIGEIPASFCKKISEGLWEESVDVEVNKLILDDTYDLIISIGQVVPHEVAGMANHAKNIFVGCGGKNMINASHMIGALYGIERVMGKDHTPVRELFDYAYEKFLKEKNILFVLTVTTNDDEKGIQTHGLFIGESRKGLEEAISLSLRVNFNVLDKGIKKCVVYLNEKEFKTTWLGNKAVYRTRMAIADNGELYIIAPGIKRFGEDLNVDKLIRKYGYIGRDKIIDLLTKNEDLKQSKATAAHLIHGSSDGRFSIHYAVKNISKEEIASVGYIPEDCDEIMKKYDFEHLKDGYNYVNGEEIYYISNPALGLWINKERIQDGRK